MPQLYDLKNIQADYLRKLKGAIVYAVFAVHDVPPQNHFRNLNRKPPGFQIGARSKAQPSKRGNQVGDERLVHQKVDLNEKR